MLTYLETQTQTVLNLLYNAINARNKVIELALSINTENIKSVLQGKGKNADLLNPLFFKIIKEIEKVIEDYMGSAEIALTINRNQKVAKFAFAKYEEWYAEQQRKGKVVNDKEDTKSAGDE